MEPYTGPEEDVEVTKTDMELMQIVDLAFESSPQLKAGLPSMLDDIREHVKDLVSKKNAAPNLQELFEIQGHDAKFNMSTLLASMLVSTIKQNRTSLGKQTPAFLEEVELMLSREAVSQQRILDHCMGEI
jgi:hypothetical protein